MKFKLNHTLFCIVKFTVNNKILVWLQEILLKLNFVYSLILNTTKTFQPIALNRKTDS